MDDNENDDSVVAQLPLDWLRENGISDGDHVMLTLKDNCILVQTEKQFVGMALKNPSGAR